MNRMCFTVDLPYPSMCNITPNPRYAKILSRSYAGKVSEVTALMQYYYQHALFCNSAPEIAEIVIGIGQVEVTHLTVLGELLMKLGMPPKYCCEFKMPPTPWNACNVDYVMNIPKAILSDIKGEEIGMKQYREAICLIDCPDVDAVIHRFILDEELHIKILSELYRQYAHQTDCGCERRPTMYNNYR